MLMISHARQVTRNDLARIPTPEPTESWTPVAHHDVATTLIDRARAHGLKLRAEKYALADGALHPQPGVKIEMRGARLFGSLDFEPLPGMPFPAGCTPSAGLRNSHDKTFALSILSGARVFVCANGVLVGEHILTRKHTSRLDLVASIDSALQEFFTALGAFHQTYERLRAVKLTRMRARSLAVELAEAGAFASSDIVPVVAEFEQPRHLEFAERTGWSFYQAATEIMKKQSEARQVEGFKGLNAVLLAGLN